MIGSLLARRILPNITTHRYGLLIHAILFIAGLGMLISALR